jgi:hypothetical protein
MASQQPAIPTKLGRPLTSVSLSDAELRLLERLRPGMEQISDALEEVRIRTSKPRVLCCRHAKAELVGCGEERIQADEIGAIH